MQNDRRPTSLLLAALAALTLGPLAWAQDTAPAEPETDAPSEVTLGGPPAADPLAPGRADPDPVAPNEHGDTPRVEGILGIPSTRYAVDPRVLGVAPGERLPNLRREGEFLRDQPGRLLPAEERGYAVFVFDVDEAAGIEKPLAVVVAPNRALESMEQLVKQREDSVGFTVSGQVHTYRGVNYLMITAPPRPWLEDAGVSAAPDEGDTDADDTDAAESPGDDPAVVEATPDQAVVEDDPDEAAPLSPEDELAELLGQRSAPGSDNSGSSRPGAGERPGAGRDTPTLPNVRRGGGAVNPAVAGVAPGQDAQELVDEGAFLVRRTGRLVRSGDGAHAMFVFDGGTEPPMILQACKLLEEMEAVIHQYGDHLPLVVTGQVQTYRGANYLLPTIMRQQFDRGNLE